MPLTSLITLYAVLANLFVLKQITILGMEVTSADAFIIGIGLALNLLQEKAGKPAATRAVFTSLAAIVIYTVLAQLQLAFIPNAYDTTHEHFVALLSIAPRITAASLISYTASQFIEINLYAYARKHFAAYFFLRNYLSLSISQLVDTVFFTFLAFYGIMHNLGHLIIFSYTVKLVSIGIDTVLATIGRSQQPIGKE